MIGGVLEQRSQICQRQPETGSRSVREHLLLSQLTSRFFLAKGAIMEAKFQIFLILLAVLAGTTLLARRFNVAPAILLMLSGIALAFVPGMRR
jgi:hypothetical protein